MKTCNKCRNSKLESEFKADPRNRDGLQGICKDCNRDWQRQRREVRASGKVAFVPRETKVCNKCRVEKPRDAFYADKGCADGLATICKPCRDVSMRAWRENNREKYNADTRQRRATQRERHKDIDLRRTYPGMTLERYNAMLTEQNGLCAICGDPPKGRRPLCVDHNHDTGAVRGLLCYGCNRALHVLENPELLMSAQAYLKKHASGG